MNFLEIIFILLLSKNFEMAKNVRGFLKNLFEYFLKFFMYLFIYLLIYFWILLWVLTSLVIWNLNIAVITTLKYCYKKALKKKLKLMGGAIKYLMKKLLGYKILWSMVSWATKCFWKIYKTLCPPLPPPLYSIILLTQLWTVQHLLLSTLSFSPFFLL